MLGIQRIDPQHATDALATILVKVNGLGTHWCPEAGCHPEHPRGIFSTVIVARAAATKTEDRWRSG